MVLEGDTILLNNVRDALNWQPQLFMSDIQVSAQDGVITLTGAVECYGQKEEALYVTRNTVGVKVVVDNIRVKINTWNDPADEAFEKQIINIFKWNCNIPDENIKVRVENGWVTLEGKAQWHYQKEAAEKAVNVLLGVKGINNLITCNVQTGLKVNKASIEAALNLSSHTATEKIKVETAGNRVTLLGSVSSWDQKEAAEKIVWCAPGVQKVDNQLVIEIPQLLSNTESNYS